ncbi:MAG TPA: GAF domain-containing SpoIIE family protein phosphatase, partial [Frankiaceae bacterium]|nr:GAF domain-containing SpoIIE family protein phosphatase [Frankiaceae bacterium]
ETLDRLARLIAQDRADWCAVLLPDGRGHLVPRVCVHADPAKAPLAAQVPSTGPFEIAGPAPAADVYRSGRPVLAPHLDRQAFMVGTDPRLADLAERLGLGSGMLLPMVARGRTIGVLSIIAGPDRPPFTPSDLDLYADLARRAAVALDNARLFGQRSRIASRLQESLLPAELPAVAGLDLAVRYETAEEAVDVGGDFYDVFPTGPDEWLVVIGDVAGRGIDAAGVTGLARQTLRAIGHDLGPAAALRRLNDLLYAQQAVERFLTAACGRLTRRGDGTFGLTLARGGHAPPLLRHADGHAEPVGEPGTLLGALPSVDCPETHHVLGPGDTLLLYTDGVVEARGPHGLFGEERLAQVVTACPAGGADVFAACVERAVVGYRTGGAADDLALLVVRVGGDG